MLDEVSTPSRARRIPRGLALRDGRPLAPLAVVAPLTTVAMVVRDAVVPVVAPLVLVAPFVVAATVAPAVVAASDGARGLSVARGPDAPGPVP
ncbi:hypothetical protein GCM10011490_09250 [Pseudoclavibacter endophyticus]|nr:hypothetical protein GCM10011490_09250 [Pseudoclavibacter endophyticus]